MHSKCSFKSPETRNERYSIKRDFSRQRETKGHMYIVNWNKLKLRQSSEEKALANKFKSSLKQIRMSENQPAFDKAFFK